MSILSTVVKGKKSSPDFLLIHGPDKIGKTTFSASAPEAIIIGPEDGAKNIDVAKLPPPKSYEELERQLVALRDEPHGYKTVGIDSLDHIEPMIWDTVCRLDGVKSIEQVGGGYGKGYTMALKVWESFLSLCRQLRDVRGMNVHLIAHSHIKTFNDPATGSSYDRYVLKMNDKASALCREKVDTILFANFKVYTKGKEGQKHKAFGDGTRVIYTERRPAFDAGNRFGLPFELPLSYPDYRSAIDADPVVRSKPILEEIEALKAQCPEDLRSKVVDAVTKPESLVVIRDRLRAKLMEDQGNESAAT
jgi:hypothetical protein